MSLYDEAIPQTIKMLRNLDTWLEEAVGYAQTRGFEPDVLLQSRLAPDMFPLVRQIQSAADGAKLMGARLAGVEAPKHPDTETTIPELRTRLAEVAGFLEGLPRDAIDAGGDRELFLPFLRGGSVVAGAYARQFALPNFSFHVCMAYALLRHGGVPLGKMKYIGSLPVKAPTA